MARRASSACAVSNEGGRRIDHNDVLRCWLDVESAAARNDVTLAPGRCYFEAAVWRSPNDLAAGRSGSSRRSWPILKAQDELERALRPQRGRPAVGRQRPDRDGEGLRRRRGPRGEAGRRAAAAARGRAGLAPAGDPPALRALRPAPASPRASRRRVFTVRRWSLFGDEHLALGTWRSCTLTHRRLRVLVLRERHCTRERLRRLKTGAARRPRRGSQRPA